MAPARALEERPRLAERPGLGVYRQGGLVAENVADHRGQHEGELGMARRYGQDVDARVEQSPFQPRSLSPPGPPCGHGIFLFPWRCRGRWPAHARCAHDDEGFGRKIDVFFVLDNVEGYRLVAQLRKFDPDLGGRHMVRPAADDGPRTAGRRDQPTLPWQFLAAAQAPFPSAMAARAGRQGSLLNAAKLRRPRHRPTRAPSRWPAATWE